MTHQAPYYLAIDSGGTKTTAWLATDADTIVGRGQAGPMSLAATSTIEAVDHLREAVATAIGTMNISNVASCVIGSAGVDTPSEHHRASELFSAALRKTLAVEKFSLVNDIVIALDSGTQSENAIALIAGTGSNCFGRNARGQEVKVGGLDFLLSDQGSGFDIGQQVLRSAVKSFDGRGAKSVLERLVCEHFHIDSIAELKDKVYHPPLNKTQIAQLARLCFVALEQKDTRANEIVTGAIEEMVEMVSTTLFKLDLAQTETDVVLVGGIATDPYVKKLLTMRLNAHFPKVSVIVPEHPPVYGALVRAISIAQSV